MVLSSFSALLQLAATINIAFIAVEYAQGYTHTLSKNIFRFPDQIKDAFGKLKNELPDDDTLNGLVPHQVDELNTTMLIEKIKRDKEICLSQIESTKSTLEAEINQICHSKSFPFLSLYFSIYCIIALFITGFSHTQNHLCLISWDTYTILSFIMILVGWWRGELDNQWKYLNFTRLKHALTFTCIFLLLSFLCGLLLDKILYNYLSSPLICNIFVIASTILPFLNFIAFFYKTQQKAHKVKSSIDSAVAELRTSINDINEKKQSLIISEKVKEYISLAQSEN